MSINIENFKLARQWLAERPDENFDMDWWFYSPQNRKQSFTERDAVSAHACGTTACLGGVIEIKTNGDVPKEFLGLSWLQEQSLFFNSRASGDVFESFYNAKSPYDPIEKSEVLSKLDQIIAAGKWPDEFV